MISRAERTIALASLVLLAACGSGSTAPADSLAAARARWARNAPPAYSYTIQRSCECTAEMTGPVAVVVRGGVVESRQYVSSGASVAPQYASIFPAVEGLFTIIERVATPWVPRRRGRRADVTVAARNVAARSAVPDPGAV